MGNSIRKLDKDQILNYYEFQEKIQTTRTYVVHKVSRKFDGQIFALRTYSTAELTSDELSLLYEEVELLQRIQHPNCLRLHEVLEEASKLYLVMDYLGDSHQLFIHMAKQNFSEKDSAKMFHVLIRAVYYLHEEGIVHRNLKPENLMIAGHSESSMKVTAFDHAKWRLSVNDVMYEVTGPPDYVAPEILAGGGYGMECDIWSLGGILYTMLCGFPPFRDPSLHKLYEKIQDGNYHFPSPFWDNISKPAKDLINKMLTLEPKERITLDEILKHPWLTHDGHTKQPFNIEHMMRLQMHHCKDQFRQTIISVIALNKLARVASQLFPGVDQHPRIHNGKKTSIIPGAAENIEKRSQLGSTEKRKSKNESRHSTGTIEPRQGTIVEEEKDDQDEADDEEVDDGGYSGDSERKT